MTLDVAVINPPPPTPNCISKEGRCAGRGFLPLIHLTPLSLLYPAAVIEAQGHTVNVHDGVASGPLPATAIDADLVLVNISPASYTMDMEFVRAVKEQRKDTLVAALGTLATTRPDRIIADGADMVLRGEIESTVAEVTRRLVSGLNLVGVPGLSFRSGGRTVHGADSVRPDLDALPYPARHLIERDNYRFLFTGDITTSVLTGRGCPHRCTFCASSIINGTRTRDRDPRSIVEEIRYVHEHDGTTHFILYSDTFNASRRFVLRLCDELVREDMDIEWACNSRADGLDDEVLGRMSRAGCRHITIGAESGSDTILERACKGETTAVVHEAVDACSRAGIDALVYFIFGLPGETRQTVQETLDFAASLSTDFVMFSTATPYIGTPFAKEVGFDNDDLDVPRDEVNAIVDSDAIGITPQEIEDAVKESYIRFYMRPKALAHHASRIVRSPKMLGTTVTTAAGLARYVLGMDVSDE